MSEDANGKKDAVQNEKVVIVTGFGKKLLRIFCLFLLLFVFASLLLFNWQLLTENPFSAELRWKMPSLVCRNTHGNMVVVDKAGKRVVILNEAGKIHAQFHANPFSKRAISYVLDAAVDDQYIYLLDLQHSPNGAQINGERVLVYDLNGKYVETAYELLHPDAAQREHVLCDVSCYNGKIFISKREKEKLSVYQIVNKKLQLIQTLDFPGKAIFSATFMPDTKSTHVATRDGCYYLNYLNNLEVLNTPDEKTHWNDVYISPAGDRYYLDSNKHEIIRVRPNVKKKKFIQLSSRDEVKVIPEVHSLWMSWQDDILTWCSPGENKVVIFNAATWEKTEISQVPQETGFLLFRALVWLCALSLFVFAARNIIGGIIKFLQKIRSLNELECRKSADSPEKIFSLWDMYGPGTIALIFAFIAVTCVMSFFIADKVWQTMESSVKSTAAELKGLPGNVFGDYLAEINSPKDYNSKSFRIMQKVAGSICFSAEGATFDLGLSVMRKLPNGEYMYVIDNFDRYPIGKTISKSDPVLSKLYRNLQKAAKDESASCQIGSAMYYVLSKIRDSNGEEAGIVMISCNKENVYSETRSMIIKLSVDLLLLFIIFVLLSGEIKLTLEFRKLRKVQPDTGKLLHTVCEAHRSCQSLTVMSLYLDAAFLPTLAVELAKSSGIEKDAAFLAALPLSCRSFMLVLALALGGSLAKYRPALFLKCSAVLSVFCYAFLMNAVLAGQYVWFLCGVAALGIMHGLKFASLDAVSSSGLQPENKFKNLVFVNTEYLIGAAVGTSIGSLLCAKFGYIAVFALGIYFEVALFAVTNSFIAGDINMHQTHSLLHHTRQTLEYERQKIRNNFRHILRPELLALLFCAMVPMSILAQFDSYVLPIYNAWSGESQLLTGFTGTVTKILALILIPYIFNRLIGRGNRLPILAGMFFTAAGLVFFAFDTSLPVMGFLLLIITVFNIVFTTNAERLRLAVAEKDHVKYNDVIGFFHAFQYLGAAVSPILMGFFLKFGFRLFCLIFAAAIFVLLIVFYLFSSRLRRFEIGKCL